MSVYQWIGGSNADLGVGGNWTNLSSPGMGTGPGVDDVAIIQVGQDMTGTLDVNALDLVQANGVQPLTFDPGTRLTADSVGVGYLATMTEGVLEADSLGIDGDGTVFTINDGDLLGQGGTTTLTVGASTGNSSLVLKNDSFMDYSGGGTELIGTASGSKATMSIASGAAAISNLATDIGQAAGSVGRIVVMGALSELNLDGQVTVGDEGTGVISVAGGAFAGIGNGITSVGGIGGAGTLAVTGAGSEISVTGILYVGNIETDGTTAPGIVTVSQGGTLAVSQDLSFGAGSISVSGAGSVLSVRGLSLDGTVNKKTVLSVTNGASAHMANFSLYDERVALQGSISVSNFAYFAPESQLSGSGTLTAGEIQNDGVIMASGGTLALSGPLTSTSGATGQDMIASGATLQINGSVVSNQRAVFQAGATALALKTPASFAGKIEGFGGSEKIDLLGEVANGLSFANDILTVKSGTATLATLHLIGSYTAADFHLASDAHGGSFIEFSTTDSVARAGGLVPPLHSVGW